MVHRPRKRFGQHFLHDAQIIARILSVINPQSGQHLIEIGPGRGALTSHLLRAGVSLDALELDRDLVPLLHKACEGLGEIRVHNVDALRCDLTALAAPGQRVRLVGNLPYNISTPLLFHFINHNAVISDMHFMLQREVVERMAATPGGKDYGRLSVMVQYHCVVEPLFHVPPTAFFPPPRVESMIVRLTPHTAPPIVLRDYSTFARLVTQAFSQRRKTLRNSLRGVVDEAMFAATHIAAERRAETLSLAEFAALANCLA